MKTILVIDEMPKSCGRCPVVAFKTDHFECQWRYIKNPDIVQEWCPLKPIPEKRNCGEKTSEAGKIFEAWCWGWDACIDEILGETE